jgi:hypothetical protein
MVPNIVSSRPAWKPVQMEVILRYCDGCPHWETVRQRLRAALDEAGHEDTEIVLEMVVSTQQAQRLGFIGSPSIIVDGRDPFAQGDEPSGLACRLYRTPNGLTGSPTQEQLAEQLR